MSVDSQKVLDQTCWLRRAPVAGGLRLRKHLSHLVLVAGPHIALDQGSNTIDLEAEASTIRALPWFRYKTGVDLWALQKRQLAFRDGRVCWTGFFINLEFTTIADLLPFTLVAEVHFGASGEATHGITGSRKWHRGEQSVGFAGTEFWPGNRWSIGVSTKGSIGDNSMAEESYDRTDYQTDFGMQGNSFPETRTPPGGTAEWRWWGSHQEADWLSRGSLGKNTPWTTVRRCWTSSVPHSSTTRWGQWQLLGSCRCALESSSCQKDDDVWFAGIRGSKGVTRGSIVLWREEEGHPGQREDWNLDHDEGPWGHPHSGCIVLSRHDGKEGSTNQNLWQCSSVDRDNIDHRRSCRRWDSSRWSVGTRLHR